jgi:4-hydroxy-tetrahydrodipicolinate synthase
MTKIGRILTAMVTPFNQDGSVDYKQARLLATALLDSGSDGIVASGTTGESPTLTKDEKLQLFAELKSEIGSRGSIIAGTGNYNTKESVEFTKEAEKEGVDGILLVVPSYNKPPQEGLYQHFKAIASSVNLPVILYNVPSRTSLNMLSETTIRLSDIDNIVGVKEASNDQDQIARIIDKSKSGFLVWSGNDNETFQIVSMGGYGVISVASHLVGIQIKSMVNNIVAGKSDKAASEHIRLLPLFNVLFTVSSPIPLKYCLSRAGFNVGPTRLPLVALDNKSALLVDSVLKDYRVDLPIPIKN